MLFNMFNTVNLFLDVIQNWRYKCAWDLTELWLKIARFGKSIYRNQPWISQKDKMKNQVKSRDTEAFV